MLDGFRPRIKFNQEMRSIGGDLDGKRQPKVGCWRNSDGNLYVPNSYFVDDNRKLNHNWLDNDWDSDWVFVAFREL